MTDRCTAETIMSDDRWGGFRLRCDLPAGHDGPHRHEKDAHDPAAWLMWEGTYR